MAGGRRRWYERYPEARRHLRQPVISVGNLSVGGTGKTPLVSQVAAWLLERGERPSILTRGYKRQAASAGVTVVSDGAAIRAGLDVAGDEPLMLGRQLPGAVVCVCDDRHTAGALAERVLGATVHILDDGFQHVQLARDCDILLTAPGEITRGRVLPFGRLRESRSAAARAQFVVVVGADMDAARAEAWELGISAFSAATRRLDTTALAGSLKEPVVAAAGLGRPEQFFAMLRDAGIDMKKTLTYADHYRYRPADVARIDAALREAGARVLLTTEKDRVRFEPLQPLPFSVMTVPMRLELADWDGLTDTIADVLARRRSAA